MEIIIFLSIVIAVVAVLTSIVLIRRVKKQIAEAPEIHTFSLPLLSSRSRFDPPISRSDLFQLSAQDMRKPW